MEKKPILFVLNAMVFSLLVSIVVSGLFKLNIFACLLFGFFIGFSFITWLSSYNFFAVIFSIIFGICNGCIAGTIIMSILYSLLLQNVSEDNVGIKALQIFVYVVCCIIFIRINKASADNDDIVEDWTTGRELKKYRKKYKKERKARKAREKQEKIDAKERDKRIREEQKEKLSQLMAEREENSNS